MECLSRRLVPNGRSITKAAIGCLPFASIRIQQTSFSSNLACPSDPPKTTNFVALGRTISSCFPRGWWSFQARVESELGQCSPDKGPLILRGSCERNRSLLCCSVVVDRLRSKYAHHCRHSRTVALTDRRGGCQTVAGRIEEKRLRSAFPFCSAFAVQ